MTDAKKPKHGGTELGASLARVEAAAAELATVAGEQAVRQVEQAVARLRAGVDAGMEPQQPTAPATPHAAPPRHPLWLWSNKPRSRKLYRARRGPCEGKLLGVCAGVANLYGLEPLVLRLALFALFCFTNGAALIAYVVAAFIMDLEPAAEATARRAQAPPRPARSSRTPKRTPASAVCTTATTPQADLATLRTTFAALEQRLRRLESFVTSERFNLHREFAKMGADA